MISAPFCSATKKLFFGIENKKTFFRSSHRSMLVSYTYSVFCLIQIIIRKFETCFLFAAFFSLDIFFSSTPTAFIQFWVKHFYYELLVFQFGSNFISRIFKLHAQVIIITLVCFRCGIFQKISQYHLVKMGNKTMATLGKEKVYFIIYRLIIVSHFFLYQYSIYSTIINPNHFFPYIITISGAKVNHLIILLIIIFILHNCKGLLLSHIWFYIFFFYIAHR